MKKVDWDAMYKNPMERNLGGKSGTKGKYSSGKELLAKAYNDEIENTKRTELLQKMIPAFNQLLLIRLKNKTPIKVMRPLRYQTCEMGKSMIDGQEVSTGFKDVVKVISPGTNLEFLGLDNPMQQFLFKSDQGEEIEINFADKQGLFLSTDIYEVVSGLFEQN